MERFINGGFRDFAMDTNGIWIVNAFKHFEGKNSDIVTKLEVIINNPKFQGFVDGLFERKKTDMNGWDGESAGQYKKGYNNGQLARAFGYEPKPIKPSMTYST